jgi:hypothetical protein
MKRRRFLLLLALAVVAAGFVLVWPRGPREPVHQGKPLSRWLEEAMAPSKRVGGFFAGTTTESREWTDASSAVRAIGTNALPWLLYEFNSQEPTNGLRVTFNRWALKHPRLSFRFHIDSLRVTRAASGLQMLGPAVTPALPELARYFGDARRASDAIYAMAGAGELAIPWFRKALGSTNAQAEVAVVACLERLATTSAAAIPPLVEALQHTNVVVRRTAAWGLDAYTPPHDLTVAALTEALSDPDPAVRLWAAQALGWRATHAAQALPALRRLMLDSNRHIAEEASNAVVKITSAAPPKREP